MGQKACPSALPARLPAMCRPPCEAIVCLQPLEWTVECLRGRRLARLEEGLVCEPDECRTLAVRFFPWNHIFDTRSGR
ncbi:uncharacterized protein LOC124668633 isoform X2 [Lolium rigidum]|uniref:uncharacterized protein LOC124668633 isoform X2 n=1 Tax=Lolium rigidum TaxID=89674 RepID=UPI001F5D4503|nr:uncharacterized protein LOC124668633 isoform X2 [Lolium rigidum]